MSLPKISVIIPALNEESSIGNVLADIPKELIEQVIVVDNGSSDQTASVALNAGATVVYESQKGYGFAALKGIEEAKKNPPDIIVFLDADYSDYPQEMHLLLDPIIKQDFDFVIGSRMKLAQKGAFLPQARYGNRLAVTLIALLYGFHYTDLGPFRAIRFDKLLALQMKDTTFGWTVEMQIKAVQHKLKITEVSVHYRHRIGVSKITGTVSGTIKAGVKILWWIFKSLR